MHTAVYPQLISDQRAASSTRLSDIVARVSVSAVTSRCVSRTHVLRYTFLHQSAIHSVINTV